MDIYKEIIVKMTNLKGTDKVFQLFMVQDLKHLEINVINSPNLLLFLNT